MLIDFVDGVSKYCTCATVQKDSQWCSHGNTTYPWQLSLLMSMADLSSLRLLRTAWPHCSTWVKSDHSLTDRHTQTASQMFRRPLYCILTENSFEVAGGRRHAGYTLGKTRTNPNSQLHRVSGCWVLSSQYMPEPFTCDSEAKTHVKFLFEFTITACLLTSLLKQFSEIECQGQCQTNVCD